MQCTHPNPPSSQISRTGLYQWGKENAMGPAKLAPAAVQTSDSWEDFMTAREPIKFPPLGSGK